MKNFLTIIFILFIVFLFPQISSARSGCCSHHDGVCGCSNGRQVCCDGSLSPSCTCASPTPAPVPKSTPPATPTPAVVEAENIVKEEPKTEIKKTEDEICKEPIKNNTKPLQKVIDSQEQAVSDALKKYKVADNMMWINGLLVFLFALVSYSFYRMGNEFKEVREDKYWSITKTMFVIFICIALLIWFFL